MHRNTLLASTLAVLMAGAASFAMAQDAPPPLPPPAAGPAAALHAAPKAHGDHHGFNMHQRSFGNEHGGVIGDLRGLERLYMQAGRSKDLAALYNDVLAKSQDPRVRDYVYQHLARLQARPTNVDQAIATLRKGLDENLANEAKMRAEHDKMRDAWKQHAGAPMPPAPAPAAQ